MLAIALWGFAGVGKDEIGKILIDRHGFTRSSKGDYIKRAVEYVDPWVSVPSNHPGVGDASARLSGLLTDRSEPGDTWLDTHDRVKRDYPDLRRYQQRIADAVVEVCGIDPWTHAMWRDIDASGADRVVMTRMCLPIEAKEWKRRGGFIWAVERPGYGPANDDPNEIAMASWPFDEVIVNDGSLERLAHRADHLVAVAEVLRVVPDAG